MEGVEDADGVEEAEGGEAGLKVGAGNEQWNERMRDGRKAFISRQSFPGKTHLALLEIKPDHIPLWDVVSS